MNIPSLPDEVPCQKIVEFISELKERIFHFQKAQEDQETKFAKKLLFQARRLKIKDLPSEVPQENLEQFNENLCHLIKEANERRAKEAYEFMLEYRKERESQQSTQSNN